MAVAVDIHALEPADLEARLCSPFGIELFDLADVVPQGGDKRDRVGPAHFMRHADVVFILHLRDLHSMFPVRRL